MGNHPRCGWRCCRRVLACSVRHFAAGPSHVFLRRERARSRPSGKGIDFPVPLADGGVRLEPGELLFGDIDGVCIIPRAAEEDVVRKALEKAREESVLERALREGMSAADAFARYGIM